MFVTAVNGLEAVQEVQKSIQQFVESKDKNGHVIGPDAPINRETSLVHFDAIILDLNMPIMDGYEACNQIT